MKLQTKHNLIVFIVILVFGWLSTFIGNASYGSRRLLSILISVIEVMLVLYLVKKQKLTYQDLGMRLPKKSMAWVVGIGCCMLPIALMIILSGGNLKMVFPAKLSLLLSVLQTIYYFLIVAPSEELIFRGFLFENFKKIFSLNKSILLTSSLFSIAHIFNGSLMNIIMAFVISLIYCKVKCLKSNQSLYPCMLGHAITDSLNQWIPYLFL